MGREALSCISGCSIIVQLVFVPHSLKDVVMVGYTGIPHFLNFVVGINKAMYTVKVFPFSISMVWCAVEFLM